MNQRDVDISYVDMKHFINQLYQMIHMDIVVGLREGNLNYRWILTIATLLPMTVYYLQLNLAPKALATHFFMGVPGSIFWGVIVMFWGVLMAILYVIFHQKFTKQRSRI